MNEKGILIARLLLGLIFFVFGLNGFLGFMPMPPLAAPAEAFFTALYNTGYIIPLVKVIEVVTGALLLANIFVPLSLVLLAPIVVNILLFHTLLDTSGLPMALIITLITLYLIKAYKGNFAGVFESKASPE